MSFAHLLRAVFSLLAVAVISALTGCQQQDQITSYSVPKPESIATPINRPNMPAGLPPMANRPAPASSPAPELKYDTPEGWQEGKGNAFSMAALEVVDGDERIETTVSAAGGDLLANMNRWRGQVGLPETSEKELSNAFQPLEVNGKEAMYIEMHSPESAAKKDSILGVVIPDGDRTWFVKLRGSTDLAKREKEKFQAFAKSLRW